MGASRFRLGGLASVAAWLVFAPPASAEEEDTRTAKALQDNSFLLEEAYNQEPGVVQHIATLRRQGRDRQLAFTQEWPIGSQTHQFSYTVPYLSTRNDEGRRVRGFSDVLVNYRFQALYETDRSPAFAPRISAILPTGSERRGLGDGSLGYEINLPFSKIVSDRVTLHANASMNTLFDVQRRTPVSFSVGGSAIYAVSREFNLMLESLAERLETVNSDRNIERERALIVSPGFRYAFNLDAGQLVVGVGAPVRFTKGSKPDYGAIAYLSFEHKFRR